MFDSSFSMRHIFILARYWLGSSLRNSWAWQHRRSQEVESQPRRSFFSRYQEDPQQKSLLLWGMWLLTMGVFFSVAGFFHQYYLTVMAPAVCALFGIGVVVMWNDYRRVGWRGWLLPLALLATARQLLRRRLCYRRRTGQRWDERRYKAGKLPGGSPGQRQIPGRGPQLEYSRLHHPGYEQAGHGARRI